jgi:SNF family Na+-dependent transporter
MLEMVARQALYSIPGYLVYTLGVAIAVGWIKRKPRAAWTLLAGTVLMLLGSLIGLAYPVVIPRLAASGNEMFMTVFVVFNNALHAVGLAMVLLSWAMGRQTE